MKPFKFKFKKSKTCKILSFNIEQILSLRNEVRVDFLALLLTQIRAANNSTIRLDHEIELIANDWLKEFNEKSNRKSLIEHYKHLALMDFCSNSVNISCVDDFEIVVLLLDDHYKWRDSRA